MLLMPVKFFFFFKKRLFTDSRIHMTRRQRRKKPSQSAVYILKIFMDTVLPSDFISFILDIPGCMIHLLV